MPAQHVAKFLRHKSSRRPATLKFYRAGFKAFLDYAGDAWPPTAETIDGFLADLRRQGYTENTIFAYWRVVRAWCAWLYKSGVIQSNPAPLVDAPGQPRRKIPRSPRGDNLYTFFCFLEDRVEAAVIERKLADHWQAVHDLAVFSLAFDTGLRLGELSALDLSDLDLEQRTVLVRDSKTGSQRVVPFGKHTRGDLALWERIRAGLGLLDDQAALFVSRSRFGGFRRSEHWHIRNKLEELCQLAGVDRFTPHMLRHAYANQSLSNGANLADLQASLGHASLKTTSIYTMMHIEQRQARSLATSPRSGMTRR
jgi:integrase/recombinase XerC